MSGRAYNANMMSIQNIGFYEHTKYESGWTVGENTKTEYGAQILEKRQRLNEGPLM